MTIDQIKQEIIEEFKNKFDARITTCDLFYQNHHGSAWTGQTIPEWLSESLDRLEKEMKKEYEDELVRLRVYWKKRIEAKKGE